MDIGPNISWKNLLKAIQLYEAAGFTYIEVPWLVSEKAIKSTFQGHQSPTLKDLYAVGSAEQSFVQLQLDGKLPPGRYVTMTPCFRDEPVIDELHQNHFMKVEFYITDDTSQNMFEVYVKLARTLFSALCETTPKIVKKNDGTLDIEINGIEVGSYGIREYEGTTWVYGTALAEPRFTLALEKKNEQ